MPLPDEGKKFGSKIKGRSEKTKRNKSISQEERIAEKGGGRRVPGSGSLGGKSGAWDWGPDGDVDLDDFMVEAKRTDTKSIRIDEKIITKAYREANRAGKTMAIGVEVGGFQSNLVPSEFMIIEEDVFFALLEAARGGGEDE